MAGGIFVDQPFHPNTKCLVFGALLMIAYWYVPTGNHFMLPIIFITGYIAMAWYDYMYHCSERLYSGTSIGLNTLDTWGKPQRRQLEGNEPDNLLIDQEKAYLNNVNLFHVFFVGPMLAVTGYLNGQYGSTASIGALAIWAMLYHGFRLISPRTVGAETNISINLLHVLVVVPFFAYVAIFGTNAHPSIWLSLMVLGGVTSSFHLFKRLTRN